MAKRIRVTKPDAPVGFVDVATTSPVLINTAPKGKAPTPTNAEGKHVMLPAFLSKTYEIFSMPEFSHVCGWNANGDTIIVSQLEAFVAMVLPRFFKHRNFPSFVRQLNLYGFHKTVLDSKRLEFQHPYFKRGRPDLLHHIKRKVSNSSHHNQQLVSTSIQNSRLDAHREISDTLLREMKELRQRSDAMEKRLRDLEIDNAIVRSDNVKLWKHLESAKDKQLIMQEKMKKIMWILFQIYRGKQQNLPKLSGNDVAGAVVSEDYKLDVEPSSVVEVPSEVEDLNPFAMTVPSNKLPVAHQDGGQNNILSIFSPINAMNNSVPSIDPMLGGFLTNGVETVPSISQTSASAPTASTPIEAAPTGSASTVSTPDEGAPVASNRDCTPSDSTVASNGTATEPSADANNQLAFLDEELPLLPDSHYNFTDGEQAVMKKLEDFETSLLDEYDVSCLDTLLQQLKSSGSGDKSASVSVADPEEVVVGPTNATPHDA
uniref:HSF-type DNA-binding domain-containing protein n=1 Tax=Phytophthora ramorum TaxID=164328 RepID=H3GHM4_PHYRM